ncbi:MAG: class I SAM-dependent methyltransferase [Acidobacteria bacterium]|nr:class I SAM-dependent methyltransferase [Acidobacteriota bacterium]
MAVLLAAAGAFAYWRVSTTPDVPYVPTPPAVVRKMLEVAEVGREDVVYDLGSGDGRIPIAAVREFGATRGVGVEIDSQLITKARKNATQAGVSDKIELIEGNLFDVDLSKATVITMYLLPAVNMRLRPKIMSLKPGTRIVSHAFDMGDWKPEKIIETEGRTIYLWRVPARY